MRALWRASIWHPDAIPPDEWKFRSMKRVWLPLYDLIVIGAGLWATAYGSPLLHRLFAEPVIDVAGMVMSVAGMVCLMGVIFPAFWTVEMVGKITVLFLLAVYGACVWFFPTRPDPASGFVVFILALGIIPPMIRLSVLGEELKERRAEKRTGTAIGVDA
jgi:hypothetical protein